MPVIAADLTKTINRCLGYVNQYGDGLSADHMAKLLPKTSRPLLREALAHLVQNELVICGNDSWYYSVEEPKQPEPSQSLTANKITHETSMDTQHMMSERRTVSDRLLDWFQQCSPSDQPIPLKDLSSLINADRDTINKALRKLLSQLSPEQAERLDMAIIRRKPKNMESKQPVDIEVISVPEPEPVFEHVDNLEKEEAPWVQEFREHLLAKRIPEHARHWQETLRNMDRVFSELGVPDSQRARKHMMEIIEWLTV